ncbi:Multidrug resistance-associated protein 1 [Boothiomyces macroporosus]|uniref:Multidrug resistance-associated protein 1 n=1 Tax=Boothiomyces macroporosus TaxID=261099 RepID=A0AAD5UDR6_9FUNG|nr:Multidrug resistance-associated protein 1 [Boothiomyces macroporosus]
MQIVKYRGMEEWFAKRIQSYRQAELNGIKKFSTLTLLIQIFLAAGGELDPSIVLPSIYLFQNLKEPVNDGTQVIYIWANLKIAWNRISGFTSSDDSVSDRVIEQLPFIESENAVELIDAVFTHTKEAGQAEPFKLGPMNLNIKKGALVIVVGAVGSGKSSFLSALTRQMELESGKAKTYGKIAYCLQTPWLISGTIKNNIEFFTQPNKENLESAIHATCLESDILSFPKGVDTLLGDSGGEFILTIVNLSGGQKARVALARALYADADIYLLDDPIAALDANVGATVFSRAVKKHLSGKTVIMLTHQLQLVQHADCIIHIDSGKVVGNGSFEELLETNVQFADLMKEYRSLDEDSAFSDSTAIPKPSEIPKQEARDIIAAEDRSVGVVKGQNYVYYAKSVGWTSLVTLLCTISTIAGGVAALIYLVDSSNNPNLPDNFIAIFTSLGVAQAISYTLMFGSIVYGCFQASKKVHASIISRLLAAPMFFYDSQPIGRILNRLNSDISALDGGIVQSLIRIILNFSNVAINSVLILQASWWVIIAISAVLFLCGILFSKYQSSNREVKRIVSISKSPLDAHVSESIRGIQTIKSCGIRQEFVNKHWKAVDDYLVSSFILDSIMMWFNLRVSLLACLLTLALMLIGVVSKSTNTGNLYITSAIGLALTAALNFSTSMFKFLLACGIWENQLNSIERLRHYELELPKEADRSTSDDPKEIWPSSGNIEFSKVVLRYASRPAYNVLDKLSFAIRGGENIGVVGRTGSGKSSMVSALFRLVELYSGTITIDGIDPVLFTGTIRENLDDDLKASDVEIWKALESVGLKEFVSGLDGKLEYRVSQKGDNFSQGQKQLICLARAIIASPKILVLDEATSSVDSAGDHLIQNVLKTQFSKSTIMSVAHRLGTIAEFDKVIILDCGRLVEFDSPANLLDNPDSLFSQLVEASGTTNANMIKSIVHK